MYCENCGSELTDRDRFCYYCGRPCARPPAETHETEAREEKARETPEARNAGESGSFDSPPPAPCPADPPLPKKVPPAPQATPSAAPAAKSDPATHEQMKKDIAGWGTGFILMGILSIVLVNVLDPVWGAVLIVLGAVNLIVRKRGMYIVNGIALIFIGIINTMAALWNSSGPIFFGVYGVFQVVWGIRELIKYKKYEKLAGVKDTASKKPGLSGTTQILIGIPLFYIGLGIVICLYELLMKGPWYTYQNIFGETHIIFQEQGSSQLPVFIRVIETLFYPVLKVFRSLFF
jgi:hypothetical protein